MQGWNEKCSTTEDPWLNKDEGAAPALSEHGPAPSRPPPP